MWRYALIEYPGRRRPAPLVAIARAMSKYRPMMVWSVACEMNDLNSLSGTSCKCEISEICEIRSEARILISLNSLFSQVTNTHAKVLGKSNAATLDRNLAYEKDHV